MKSKQFMIFDSERWHPSSFYDSNTQLVWVMSYRLFKRIYARKHQSRCVTLDIDGDDKTNISKKYAIHKDVYTAFVYRYKNENETKRKKRTRKKKYT